MAAASASVANTSTVKVYHYSKRPIEKWGSFEPGNYKSRQTIGRRGKPIGLWYAYDTSWMNALGENQTKYYKYAFPIRQDQIVDIDEKPDLKKILRLSTIKDLKDFFELTNPIGNTNSFVNANEYEAATQGGNIDDDDKRINWPAYWDRISKMYGGIEFTGELIRPRSAELTSENILYDSATGDEIDISWLRVLDIPSGVIFHPEVFFEGTPPTSFLVASPSSKNSSFKKQGGGRRQSRKKTRKSKKRYTIRRKW